MFTKGNGSQCTGQNFIQHNLLHLDNLYKWSFSRKIPSFAKTNTTISWVTTHYGPAWNIVLITRPEIFPALFLVHSGLTCGPHLVREIYGSDSAWNAGPKKTGREKSGKPSAPFWKRLPPLNLQPFRLTNAKAGPTCLHLKVELYVLHNGNAF
jgi:hypothetical protein